MKREGQANEIRLEMDARSENEGFARSVAAAFAVDMDPTLEELEDIKIAVSEAVTNCVIHGYIEKQGKIEIVCRKEGEELTISVIDHGVGISDVRQAMSPFFTTAGEKERSGMGFSFMEAFMDELHVESIPGKGTVVIMKKKIGTDRKAAKKAETEDRPGQETAPGKVREPEAVPGDSLEKQKGNGCTGDE